MRREGEKGQVALIIVLAVTVAGTLAVSLASRTTTGLRTEGRDIEGIQALKGAESGVEEALFNEGEVVGSVGDVNYVADYESVGEGGFVSAGMIQPGDVMEVAVEGAVAKPTALRIYFSSHGEAAIKVARYDSSGAVYSVDYSTFESNAGRMGDNGFDELAGSAGYTFSGVSFTNRAEVAADVSDTVFFRIMVLYEASMVGVEPVGGNLPDQQVVVSSTGEVSETNTVRTVELRKEKERVPAIFDHVLYSNSSLVQ